MRRKDVKSTKILAHVFVYIYSIMHIDLLYHGQTPNILPTHVSLIGVTLCCCTYVKTYLGTMKKRTHLPDESDIWLLQRESKFTHI